MCSSSAVKNKMSLLLEDWKQSLVLKNEGKLLAALKGSALIKLSRVLSEELVISREVRDKFASLDHDSLEQELMIRYLLQHVYDAVKNNKLVLYSFLNVLDEVDEGVAGELRREVHKFELAERVGESQARQSDMSVGVKRSQASVGIYMLCENDVPLLTKLLPLGSDILEGFGHALGLKESQIKIAMKDFFYGNVLSNILLEWIRYSNEPCMDRLKEALASDFVGLTILASDLEESFLEAKKRDSFRRSLACELHTIYRSGHTCVAYGKSALLGFQVATTDPVRYQWKKNNKPISDNEIYSGTHGAILYISYVDGQIEGQYDCQVYSGRYNLKSSEVISLTTSSTEFTNMFLSFYSKMDEIPKDSWPPVTNTEYINLALITRSKLTYTVEDYVADTIDANMKEEYKQVFGRYQSGTLLLVEGLPGSGKTTLMHKVTRDWAIKRNVLLGADIVILVPIRRFFGIAKQDITLSNIFEKYIENNEDRRRSIENIREKRGEGSCFVFDDLDDYECMNDHSTLIYKLIHKDFLPLAMVIVASCPVGTASVRNEASVYKHIEVLGFIYEDNMKFIKSYYKANMEAAYKLQSYLNLHVNVLRMCYLPVHAAMICFLYSEEGDKFPLTETQMYEVFTRFTLVRKLTRDMSVHVKINSMECLPVEVKKSFRNICRVAYEMTINPQQVFSQGKAELFLWDSFCSESASLGLDTIDGSRKEYVYKFVHITFQEYFAAYHIAGLEHQKQIEITVAYGNQPHLKMVWIFFCGIVKFHDKTLIKNIIRHTLVMSNLRCAYESQQQIVCDSVLELNNTDTLSLKDHSFLPSDFLAISYVISTTSYIVTTLIFTGCSFDGEGVALFLEKMSSDHLENIKYLGYHKEESSVAQFQILNMLLRKLTNLEILDLDDTELREKKVKKLTENVNLPNLKTLKIKLPLKPNIYNKSEILRLLTCKSTKLEQVQYECPKSKSYLENYFHVMSHAFSGVLCCTPNFSVFSYYNHAFHALPQASMKNCSKLLLINCGITEYELQLLVESMAICTELDMLHLDFNAIGSKEATLLSSCLVKCAKLEVFSAHCNQIDDSGALAIAKALVPLNNIKILDLQCNPITEEGASALIMTVKDLGEFQLYVSTNTTKSLHNCNLKLVQQPVDIICKDDNMKAIHNALKCSKFMQEVHVVLTREVVCKKPISFICNISKPITLADMGFISEGLKYCTNLQTIDLRSNSIGSDGAVALAEGLKCCTNLQNLDLSSNSIGSGGAVALAVRLKCCANLQRLDLSCNRIYSDGAVALAEGLKCCTNLQTLDLSSNSIGSDGAVALAVELKCCANLQRLDLSYNRIYSDGAVALAKGLKCCINLQELDLSSNSIGSDGAVALAEGLKCCTNLQTLDLRSNRIGSDGAVALAEGLKSCTNLEKLNLSSNSIGSDGAVALAVGLKCCANLQRLDLSCNRIYSDGAVALAEGLKCCTNLQTLDLSSNSIGSDGAVALAVELKCCANLQRLDLSYNRIYSDGAVALAKGLKCCINLQELDLSSNSIGSDGAVALAEGLKCCTNLQTLDLRSNRIGSDGAVALAEGLKSCTNLEKLNLSSNSIGSDGAVALAVGLKCCANLQRLDLSCNRIYSDVAVALAEGLKCCTNLQTWVLVPTV